MHINPILTRATEQSSWFDVVPLDREMGCDGLGWRFREGDGEGRIDFLEISPSLVLDICDFRCFRERRSFVMKSGVPLLRLRFKLNGCSVLHFSNGDDVSMLGEHCSFSVYTPDGQQHERITADLAERSATLHCDPSFFLDDLGLDPESVPQPIGDFLLGRDVPSSFLPARLTPRIRQATAELIEPSCPPAFARSLRDARARNLTLALLMQLAACEARAARVGANGSGALDLVALSPDELRRAVEWIDANLGEDRDVTAMARDLGIDALRLARGFKQSSGLSIQQYRLRARTERARQLLAETTLPIKAVAQDAGFYDQAHLTRAFRAAFGSTPLLYRRSNGRKRR